jgi:hypothetical protein
MPRHKPVPWSVTSAPCNCDLLQRAVAEPEDPIVFDEDTREYQITKPDGGHLRVFHCPFCGGATPRSRRASLFATVSNAELARLEKLTSGFRTVEEAVAALGQPDVDNPHGLRLHGPETPDAPSDITTYRTLTFTRLSEVADVELTDYGVKGLRFTFRGKYLRERRGRPTRA